MQNAFCKAISLLALDGAPALDEDFITSFSKQSCFDKRSGDPIKGCADVNQTMECLDPSRFDVDDRQECSDIGLDVELGRQRAVSDPIFQVRVKNTFIECVGELEPEGQKRRANSLPPRLVSSRTAQRELDDVGATEDVAELGTAGGAAREAPIEPRNRAPPGANSIPNFHKCAMRTADSCTEVAPPKAYKHGHVRQAPNAHLKMPSPQPVAPGGEKHSSKKAISVKRICSEAFSIGTQGHPYSCGSACKYVRRKGGCRDGAMCQNCHACRWQRTAQDRLLFDSLSTESDDAKAREVAAHRTMIMKSNGGTALSVGSLGHPHTCGAPCKYIRRRAGCRDGANCPNCHECRWRRDVPAAMGADQSLTMQDDLAALKIMVDATTSTEVSRAKAALPWALDRVDMYAPAVQHSSVPAVQHLPVGVGRWSACSPVFCDYGSWNY